MVKNNKETKNKEEDSLSIEAKVPAEQETNVKPDMREDFYLELKQEYDPAMIDIETENDSTMENSDEREEFSQNHDEEPLVAPSDIPLVTWFGRIIEEGLPTDPSETSDWSSGDKYDSKEMEAKTRKFIRQKTLASMKNIISPATGKQPYDFSESIDLEELEKLESEIGSNVFKRKPRKKVLSAKEKSIQLEKYRRNQAYTTLNYLLGNVTYADFFNYDVMTQIRRGQSIARKKQSKVLTAEYLLIGLLESDCEVKKILEEVGITRKTIETTILTLDQPEEELEAVGSENESWIGSKINLVKSKLEFIRTHREEILQQFIHESKLYFEDEISPRVTVILYKIDCLTSKIANWVRQKIDPTLPLFKLPVLKKKKKVWIKPSNNVCRIFERSAYKALEYKTPVIGPEILFLALMENKSTSTGMALRKILKTNENELSLRYKLLKRVWKNKSYILKHVKSNQHFFAFLLQSDLSGVAFNELVEKNVLADAVNLYRNALIQSALEIDIWPLLIQESYLSVFGKSKRKSSL